MKMCQAFVQGGHDLELLAPRRRDWSLSTSEELADHYGLSTAFPVTYLPWPGDWGKVLFRALAALSARRRTGSLVYSRCLPTAVLASRLNMPVIWEHHQMIETTAQKRYLKWLSRSRNLHGVVVISEALKRDFLKRFERSLVRSPVLVAHDGVDLERFCEMPSRGDARRQLGMPEDCFIAGHFGHLYPGRGIELIFELARNSPDVDFLLVGGAQKDIGDRKRQAADLGLTNVRFVGFVSNAELPVYYAACDALLMPYQRHVAVSGGGDTAGYMSPMKMFEYMATGRVILASDLPVLREVLDESKAALCDPEDISHWTETLKKAKADRGWGQALAANALKGVRPFTWKRRVANILRDTGVAA